MRKKTTLADRLILYFVLIGFLSVAGVALFTFFQYRKAILERSFEQLNAIKNIKKSRVESFFVDRLREAYVLATSSEVRQFINGMDGSKKFTEDSYIYNYIFNAFYYDAVLFSDDRYTIVQYRDTTFYNKIDSEESTYLETLKHKTRNSKDPFIFDYISTSPDSLYLTVATSVISEKGTREGFLAFQIPLGVIDDIMIESAGALGFGKSGETYLVGNDYLMRSSSRFIPGSVLHTIVNTNATESSFGNGSGTLIANDYRGISVLSSFCKLNIEGLNWVLLSEIDLKEVMAPVDKIRNVLLFVSIGLLIIVFLVGLFLSYKITAPIIQIKDAALAVSKGNFPVVNLISNNNEINELLETFNYMSAQLKEKKQQLEAEQKKHFSAMIDGQEEERKRLSLELHDGLGQSLVALKYKVESLKNKPDLHLGKEWEELETSITEIIEEIRQMSFSLMPAVLSEFGLVLALRNLFQKLEKQTGVQIIFEDDGKFNGLDRKKTTYLFRIVQEAVNNALKHAMPTLISVQLIEFPHFITLIIEDNGKGFEYNPLLPADGNGLYYIKERAGVLNGKLIIQSAPGEGTIIRIKVPKNTEFFKDDQ